MSDATGNAGVFRNDDIDWDSRNRRRLRRSSSDGTAASIGGVYRIKIEYDKPIDIENGVVTMDD